MRVDDETLFRRDLGCYAVEVRYDFVERKGALVMGWRGCCDMTGCIAFFVRIDPEVRKIETFQIPGEDPSEPWKVDTWYKLLAEGWRALPPY